MALPVFPGSNLLPGLTYHSKWTPKFFNLSSTSATGADIDVAIAQYPLHDFELSYQFLRDGAGWGNALSSLEFRTLMGFHLALGGTVGRFAYSNPDDCQVFQNQIAVGDGTTTTFTITRTFGAGGFFQTEPVGQVDLTSPLNVYLGGSTTPLAPNAYSISNANPCANTITFAAAPAAGQAITMDMQFFYYCKLASDASTFEKMMNRMWNIGKVQLHSCRPGA